MSRFPFQYKTTLLKIDANPLHHLNAAGLLFGGGPTADGEPGGVVHLEPLDGELALASHWVVMKRLVASIYFGITLSGCISYEPLPTNRLITEDEYKRRLKSHAGKTQNHRPVLIQDSSSGSDWENYTFPLDGWEAAGIED